MNKEIIGKKIKVNDFNMEFGHQAKFVNLICFYKYQKDNNLYAIYCDDTNIPYGIVNFGTAHIKGNSLIVIGSKDPNQEMIKEFTYKLSNISIFKQCWTIQLIFFLYRLMTVI